MMINNDKIKLPDYSAFDYMSARIESAGANVANLFNRSRDIEANASVAIALVLAVGATACLFTASGVDAVRSHLHQRMTSR